MSVKVKSVSHKAIQESSPKENEIYENSVNISLKADSFKEIFQKHFRF